MGVHACFLGVCMYVCMSVSGQSWFRVKSLNLKIFLKNLENVNEGSWLFYMCMSVCMSIMDNFDFYEVSESENLENINEGSCLVLYVCMYVH